MNVTVLIRDLGLAGAQRQAALLASSLPARGIHATVVTFYGGVMQGELERAGVNVINLGKRGRWDMFGFLLRLVSAIRSSRPDVLYSFLAESNLVAALMKPLLPRTRIVWGLRDSLSDADNYGWLGKAVFKVGCMLANVPDLHIANSQSGAAHYAGLGYPKERIAFVPNGIDSTRFAPDPAARERVRAELGLRPEDIVFGLVGRLAPMKDHDTFLRAAAILRDEPHARFICIGNGEETFAAGLRQLAGTLGIAERVTLLPARNDMPAVFNAFDALVSSSACSEGFSNVVGEAMACGTPCIVTQVGDSALIVGDADRSAPPQDPAALGAVMLQFARLNQEQRASLSQRSRQRIIDNFSLVQMVDRTIAHLGSSAGNSETGIQKPLFLVTALGSGGAEMMLTQLLTHLDPKRFAPQVISLIDGGKHEEALRAAGVPVHSLGMVAGKPSLKSLLKLRTLVRQIQPDLLVGWMYHGNLAATLASWIGHRAPVLWNVRQSLYSLALEKRGSAMVIKLLARLGFNPRSILYNSAVSARQHEAIGYPAAKTMLIPNGFDTTKFMPDDAARASVRAELGLPSDALLIGRFGRHSAMKDYPTFIEAMKLLPHAHAIVAGTGTTELPASPRVHFLGERMDLPRLTAALDIACSSSAFGEGFPNVVAEAMCCGVPCVVTDVGDSAWLLNNAGKVVASGDPAALAAALNAIIAMPLQERAALGLAGRQRILEHFALPAVVRQFESLLSASPTPHSSPSPLPCAA